MNEKIKVFFGRKQNVIISCVAVALAVVILIIALTFGNEKNNISEGGTTSTTESTTESTTTENPTESTTESTTESETNETITQKPETTTKKQETTTKKPVTTTKPSKSEEEKRRELVYGDYGGEEGYKKHLEEVKNYKCQYCGDHNCPSLEYGTDLLGNPGMPTQWEERCPAIKAETLKCERCGKILSTVDKDRAEPDKYCSGNCHISFS